MRNVDAMIFSRWAVASFFMVAPLVVGCGAKTDTVQDGLPSSASPQLPDARSVDALPDSGSPVDLGRSGGHAPADSPPSDANAVADEPVADGPTDDVPAGDGSDEANRPRSLFRSIGRALQKGVTDAAGATSDASNDASESGESEPTDPR